MDKSLEELGKVKVFAEVNDDLQLYFQLDRLRSRGWQFASSGYGADVGWVELLDGTREPVHVKWFIHHCNEQPVCFYYATSMVVDYSKIEAFFRKHGQRGCHLTTIFNVSNFLDMSK
jgi:hypothetical protein